MLTIGFLFVCYVSVFIIIVLLCLLLLCMLFLICMFLNTISRQRTEQVLTELDISAIEEYIIIIIIHIYNYSTYINVYICKFNQMNNKVKSLQYSNTIYIVYIHIHTYILPYILVY